VTTANYPYTTNELEQDHIRHRGREFIFLDTPGIAGLEANSEEEIPTRDLLLSSPPDILVQCVDASNLVRSMLLTAELAALKIPMVLCLNMVDEAMARGCFVDAMALGEQLGLPVVPICALDGRGVGPLMHSLGAPALPRMADEARGGSWHPSRPPAAAGAEVGAASQVAEGTAEEAPNERLRAVEAIHHWAHDTASSVTKTTGLEPTATTWSVMRRIALHPVGAWFFFGLTMVALYLLVTEVGAKMLSGGIDALICQPLLALVTAVTSAGPLQEILIGPYGLLSFGVFNALGTVLPLIGVFYLAFGLLEDIGYFPILSVMFDRFLRFLGLNGRAVLPITLGFGCNAVATMSTRCLEHRRERFIACFLIALGTPCAVQLGVMFAILSTVPWFVLAGVVTTILAVQVTAGLFLSRFFFSSGHCGNFIMEIPPMRPPNWRNILTKTYHRLKEFLIEAVPLFVASAATMLFLDYVGALARIREALSPVIVQGLGLPAQFGDALLVTIARREVGAVMLQQMNTDGLLSVKQVFIAILVMTLFVPCLTTTLTQCRTLGWRSLLTIFLPVVIISLSLGTVLNWFWVF
jgi:ferrous iron transport protein B